LHAIAIPLLDKHSVGDWNAYGGSKPSPGKNSCSFFSESANVSAREQTTFFGVVYDATVRESAQAKTRLDGGGGL